MLKILSTVLLSTVLMGCATHHQANQTAGAVIGGVVGHQVGGRAGAVVGAGLGAIIGGQQPVEQPRYYPPVYTHEHRYYDRAAQCEIYRRRESSCYQYRYSDTRAMCLEDARNRHFHCMTR